MRYQLNFNQLRVKVWQRINCEVCKIDHAMNYDTQQDTPPGVEARLHDREHRRRMLKSASASYGNLGVAMDVVVRDISSQGVRIKLGAHDPLPDLFTLAIDLDGIVVECEVVWRRGLEIGAKFISEPRKTISMRIQNVQQSRTSQKVSLRKKPIVN